MLTHFFNSVGNLPVHIYNLIGNISMVVSILFLIIVMSWIMFRTDSTKNKQGKSLNNGTQISWLVAIIGASFPITVAIAYVSKYVFDTLNKAQKIKYSLTPIGLSGQQIVIYYSATIIIALVISVVAYVFIRECGAESGCSRDIKFMRRL